MCSRNYFRMTKRFYSQRTWGLLRLGEGWTEKARWFEIPGLTVTNGQFQSPWKGKFQSDIFVHATATLHSVLEVRQVRCRRKGAQRPLSLLPQLRHWLSASLCLVFENEWVELTSTWHRFQFCDSRTIDLSGCGYSWSFGGGKRRSALLKAEVNPS